MNINGIPTAGTAGEALATLAEPRRQAESRPAPGSSALQTGKARAQAASKGPSSQEGATLPPQGKAVLAVDQDHRVVIQFLDAKGRLIMQIPPEEAQGVRKELAALMKHLFSREA